MIPALAPRWVCAVLVAAIASTAAGWVDAHGLAMSQLHLRVEGARVEGDWEAQLPDARLALGLDPRLGGETATQEVRARDDLLRAYVVRRLALTGDGRNCPVELTPAPTEWRGDNGPLLFHLAAQCPAEPARLEIDCNLLFDVDARHRAYFSIDDARQTSVGVFRDDRRSVTLEVRQLHAWAAVVEFLREGAWHIWSGYDHLLFLLALLLPASLVRIGEGWSPRLGIGPTAREVAKVVTAFTLAHSLTLCLSFFGLVTLPARWVEVAIALSVFAAAWNNVRPFLPGRAWVMALAFGLVHGLGFAGVLRNLPLPMRARGLALVAFNGGVELGQLLIVALLLPLLYTASRRRWYPRLVMAAGSLFIAWLAVLWVLERGFGLSFLAHS